jgi:hypothetical protein
MIANLSPSQEPVAWGALATAILGLLVVFAPRFGIHVSQDEQAAVGAVLAIVIPIVVGYFVRKNVTPTAPAPVVTPAVPPAA